MLLCDFQYAPHEQLMLTLRIVDQAYTGRGDSCEHGSFAAVIHSDLNDRSTMLFAQHQEGQWHTNLVVPVARSSQHMVASELRTQD